MVSYQKFMTLILNGKELATKSEKDFANRVSKIKDKYPAIILSNKTHLPYINDTGVPNAKVGVAGGVCVSI